jgi:hypothetical protein
VTDDLPDTHDDESTFDVDRWLLEARPPQRAVVVYGRGDLLSRLQELDATPEPPGQVMGGSVRVKEMARLREEIEESRRTIHVRGLLHAERTDLLARHKGRPEDPDEDFEAEAYQTEALAIAAVSPTLSMDQAARLHAALGEAQWAAVWNAVELASMEPISVPLSRLGSEDIPSS